MLRIPPSIRLRLLHCARQSVCRDDRVGNKPSRAALWTALGVRAGFSAADRFRGRSCTVRRTPECLYFMAIQYFQLKRSSEKRASFSDDLFKPTHTHELRFQTGYSFLILYSLEKTIIFPSG